MTEQPWQDRDPNPDDVNDAQLPGPEEGPVVAPRTIPEPPEGGSLDLPESPDDDGGLFPVPAM